MNDFSVRAATILDMPFVMALQRSNRESVGGLPQPALQERVERGTLALSTLNSEPSGYIAYDIRGGVLRIPQACIQYDARRRMYGEGLWCWVVNQNPTITEARLRCAADIDANLFWQAMGFSCVSVVAGGSRRGRLINQWQRWFTDAQLVSIEDMAVTPAAQLRKDCFDEQTGFFRAAPSGFIEAGNLPNIAWANRSTKSEVAHLGDQEALFGRSAS